VIVLLLLSCGRPAPSPSAPVVPASCGLPPLAVIPTSVYPCPSKADVETINAEIPIVIRADPTAGTQACRATDGSADLTDEQKLLYLQLLYMRRLSFSQPLPWTNQRLYDWFRGTIRGISMEVGNGESNCSSQEKIIHLVYKPGYVRGPLTLERLDPEGLVHEARHAVGFPHTCGALDRTVDQMGAFGVQYLFLNLMATASGEPLEDRGYYAMRAWELRTSAFCDECAK
jgi:hypothetical protein